MLNIFCEHHLIQKECPFCITEKSKKELEEFIKDLEEKGNKIYYIDSSGNIVIEK